MATRDFVTKVSTHSRPKAAGRNRAVLFAAQHGFNTQPPEGGWLLFTSLLFFFYLFQHTAARRRLVGIIAKIILKLVVSTHSRPKAAGSSCMHQKYCRHVSTHSRPKAAGYSNVLTCRTPLCFNTQPPEGGWYHHSRANRLNHKVSTHSRPKAAGYDKCKHSKHNIQFQHTAARRRLAPPTSVFLELLGFNTQPPEGGWKNLPSSSLCY